MAGKKLQCDWGWFRRVICLMETDPALAVRILGTDKETFVNIWNAAEEREDARKKELAERPDRERESGGGDKPLQVLFQLMTALVYLRQHAGCLAVQTGCSEGSVWNYIHAMLPAIKDALPAGLLEEWRRASPDWLLNNWRRCSPKSPMTLFLPMRSSIPGCAPEMTMRSGNGIQARRNAIPGRGGSYPCRTARILPIVSSGRRERPMTERFWPEPGQAAGFRRISGG